MAKDPKPVMPVTKKKTATSAKAKAKPRTVATSLEELGGAVKDLKLNIPKLRALPSLAGIGETIEQKLEAVAQVGEDVANAVRFLSEVNKNLAQYNGNRTALKIVRSQSEKGVEDMNNYLNAVFSLDDVIYQQAAAIAYVKAILSQDFKTAKKAFEALRELEDRSILLPAKQGQGRVIIGYQYYEVSEKFSMEPDDLAELSATIANFSRLLKTLIFQQRQEDLEKARREAEITLEEAMDGKNGKCLLEVPAENFVDKSGVEHWRGGGNLMVELVDKEVIPLYAIGSIEGLIRKVSGNGVWLPRFTLEQPVAPGTGNSFKKVCDAIMRQHRLNREDAQDYLNQERTLWFLINRATRALRMKKAVETTREEFFNKATISPEEFFGLNGSTDHPQNGIACLEFKGTFKTKTNDIEGLFILASRAGYDITLIEVPKHLEKTFGEFIGKKFPATDDFDKCPQDLRRVLRGIRGQVRMTVETAS